MAVLKKEAAKAVSYICAEKWCDLQDNEHMYELGDVYPRKGYKPSAERIEQLLDGSNPSGKSLLQKHKEALTWRT